MTYIDQMHSLQHFRNTSLVEDLCYKKKLNSVVLVRKRTILTERPQPVDEVNANFS
jgi:hypothetical protein